MSVTELEFSFISEIVERRSAIKLDPSKRFLADVRLPPVLKSSAILSVSDLLNRVRAGDKALEGKLVEAFTTNETFFFRDAATFEVLKKEVFAALFAGTTGPVNVWSAACSSGQEAYSLIMMAHGAFAQPERLQVQGTDLSAAMVGYATAALYTQFEVGRGLPSSLLVRHFTREGVSWQLKPELRRQASFNVHNLLDAPRAFRAFDVIFLRNVLYYFDDAARQRVLKNVRAALKPRGYIVLGTAETSVVPGFERVFPQRADILRLV